MYFLSSTSRSRGAGSWLYTFQRAEKGLNGQSFVLPFDDWFHSFCLFILCPYSISSSFYSIPFILFLPSTTTYYCSFIEFFPLTISSPATFKCLRLVFVFPFVCGLISQQAALFSIVFSDTHHLRCGWIFRWKRVTLLPSVHLPERPLKVVSVRKNIVEDAPVTYHFDVVVSGAAELRVKPLWQHWHGRAFLASGITSMPSFGMGYYCAWMSSWV